MGLTQEKLGAVQIRENLRKNPELKQLFATAVQHEMYEQERAAEMGTFRATPPDIDNFLSDIHDTIMLEFAEMMEGEREMTKQQFDHDLELLERSIAEAHVLGWLSDGYSKKTGNSTFEDFAYEYLPTYF